MHAGTIVPWSRAENSLAESIESQGRSAQGVEAYSATPSAAALAAASGCSNRSIISIVAAGNYDETDNYDSKRSGHRRHS